MKILIPLLGLTLGLAPLTAVRGASAPSAPPSADETSLTPESVLASQVSEIAAATTMTRATKEKLIASAVRLAINAAIQGIKDPARVLDLAVQLAGAAAEAAPAFADTVMSASTSVPGVARVDGAVAALQAAVDTGATSSSPSSGGSTSTARSSAPSAQFGGNTGGFAQSPSKD
jgi:hypothetical protein